ncbi:MAG: peptidase M4 family protein [Myxococcales bacterium]|nr:peptidase M4 family protein [Myxococcales bacterium]MBL0193017.1 peptidase M4 family protein [Myxococcales bacterium]HQY63539.1 M4 family metallopeptidase [Polyangiaceae bacterium]
MLRLRRTGPLAPHRLLRGVLLTLAVGASAAVAGCSAGADDLVSAAASLEQEHAQALEGAHGGPFKVEVSTELGNVRHLEGRVPRAALSGGTPGRQAVSFLAEHGELLAIGEPSDVPRALRVVSEEVSASGAHVRLQQVEGGVPVRGGEVLAHFDDDGALVALDAHVVRGVRLASTVPVVTAQAAAVRVEAELLARVPDVTRADVRPAAAGPELVVFATPGAPARLAWHHVARAMSATTAAVLDVTLDAITGAVLEAFDDLETVKATSPGVLGDMKTFEVTENGGSFTMVDKTRPAEIRTHTAATTQSLPGTIVGSTAVNTWDTTVARGKGAAVDAHFFAGFVYDYYKTKFNRSGIDGRNAPMISTAHFGNNYENAFWDGTQMAYGDGATRFKPLSAGLDVVAHEFTHGITTSTSKLVYQGQPGALNEAISDIFSSFIEHTYKADDRNNWLTGETIGASGPIRDLANPRAKGQPSHMKEFVNTQQDNGGVHINSGIPNNAAFLMTMGGTNPYSKVVVGGRLGWEKAEKLWYEVETKYLMSTSDFKAAATASKTAAVALKFSAAEVAVVECAWIAVGVLPGVCDEAAKGTPTVPDAGTPEPSGDGGAGAVSDGGAPTADGGPGASRPAPQTLVVQDGGGCAATGAPTGSSPGALVGLGLGAAAVLARRRRRLRAGAPSKHRDSTPMQCARVEGDATARVLSPR